MNSIDGEPSHSGTSPLPQHLDASVCPESLNRQLEKERYYKCIAKSTAVFTSLCINTLKFVLFSCRIWVVLMTFFGSKIRIKVWCASSKPGFKRPVCFCFLLNLTSACTDLQENKRPHGAKIRYSC